MEQKNHAKVIMDTMNLIYDNNLTTVSGGNISIKTDDGDIWISPTGIDKGSLEEEDAVCAKTDGTFIGKNKPSIEFPFHKKIYEIAPKIKAIIHTHTPNLVALSVLRSIPPIEMLPHCAQMIGRVDIAPYDVPGSYELGEKIAAVFAEGNDCVIMENHGIVLGADTMQHAFDRLEAINLIFEVYKRSKVLGQTQIPEISKENIWKNMKFKGYSETEKYETDAAEMHKYVKRIYHKGFSLTNPDMFCISKRVDDGILTNPSDIPIYNLNEASYVFVNQESIFSRHQKIHMEIYKNYPEIQCITTALAPDIMSFAVTNTELATEIIPEAYVILRNVAHLEYEDYDNVQKILDTVSLYNEIIFKNNCFMCCSSSLLNMYDRIEVLEYSAKAIIDAKSVGNIVYISEVQIKDIIKAFHLE